MKKIIFAASCVALAISALPNLALAQLVQNKSFQFVNPATKKTYNLTSASAAFKTLNLQAVKVTDQQLKDKTVLKKYAGRILVSKSNPKRLWYVKPGSLSLTYFDGSDKSFAYLKTQAEVAAATPAKDAAWDLFTAKLVASLTSPGLESMTADQIASSTTPLLCNQKTLDNDGKVILDFAFIFDQGRLVYTYNLYSNDKRGAMFSLSQSGWQYAWYGTKGKKLDLGKIPQSEIDIKATSLISKYPYFCRPWDSADLASAPPKTVAFTDDTANQLSLNSWQTFQAKISSALAGTLTTKQTSEVLASDTPLVCKTVSDGKDVTYIINDKQVIYSDTPDQETNYIIGNTAYVETQGKLYTFDITKIGDQSKQMISTDEMLKGTTSHDCAAWSMADFIAQPKSKPDQDITETLKL